MMNVPCRVWAIGMSSEQRIQLQPGFVLHQYNYRDSSLLLEVLTRDFGRVGIVARGVKKEKSKFHGVLHAFMPLLLGWSGRGELVTLTHAEVSGAGYVLAGKRLLSGFYLNEILMRLLQRHDPHPEIYTLYQKTLDAFSNGADEESILRHFECELLNSIGYGLILDHDAETGELLLPDAQYLYILEKGPIRCETVSKSSDGVRVSGKTLLALLKNQLTDESVRLEAKRLMRAILSTYLGDRPLNSADINLHKVL